MNPFPAYGDSWEADLENERQTHYEHAAATEPPYAQEGFMDSDEALAIPNPPQKRSEHETRRILSILDQIEKQNVNRRFTA